ncbi:hypothetical protein [Rhizobium multihospitium]|uniref:Uncharacterized protein n=1 Tax=Rhizobium multihospitium TaxID=410764 RepID=A0A1C3VV63_9HYPH|nr:hypothetical protein GA0061103_4327 [Rhizobium multihospitium]
MTRPDPIPVNAVMVAIDIVKVRKDMLIEARCKKHRGRLSVLNTRAEHDRITMHQKR